MIYNYMKDNETLMWKLIVKEKNGNLTDCFYIDPDFNLKFVNAVVEHYGELHMINKPFLYKIMFPAENNASDFITDFLEPWITMKKLNEEILT